MLRGGFAQAYSKMITKSWEGEEKNERMIFCLKEL